MNKNSIDARLGIGFSLEFFGTYKSTRNFRQHFVVSPGIYGPVIACIYLVGGAVASCYIEDQNGRRAPVSKDMLFQFDNENGPFEWSFYPSSARPTSSLPPAAPTVRSKTEPLTSRIPNAPLAKKVLSLPGARLLTRSFQQRRKFLLVWQEIDGKRTVDEIKATAGLSLSRDVVEEILSALLQLNLVAISM